MESDATDDDLSALGESLTILYREMWPISFAKPLRHEELDLECVEHVACSEVKSYEIRTRMYEIHIDVAMRAELFLPKCQEWDRTGARKDRIEGRKDRIEVMIGLVPLE